LRTCLRLSALALLSLSGLVAIGGCTKSGPPSTDTTSAAFGTLDEKVAFLEQYVRFRRGYRELDFAVRYLNNSGGIAPAPSEWDVRIVAAVPPAELDAWTSGLSRASAPEADWLAEVPTSIDCSGVTEWFSDGDVDVGVDRERSIVVYRNLAI
jgi:hypothetical protein